MTAPQVLTADQVEPSLLDAFLRGVYPQLKSSFLRDHGAWWHGANANRLVIEVAGRIAGYCAVIPTRSWIAGQIHPALWWVDLIVAPEFRGQRLQSLFDARVQEMSDLLLGFPNELAARIHRRHGWGVREDLQILQLPLWPRQVKLVKNTEGWRGHLLRGGALALSVPAAAWRTLLGSGPAIHITKSEKLCPGLLADIFLRSRSKKINTTWRDEGYFEWRYGAAPNPVEYGYYLAGDPAAPTHYLIARHVTQADGVRYTRILDVFGDFQDRRALRDLLLRSVQDAIAHGSGQVTVLTAFPALQRAAQQLGFLLSAPVGFCWLSKSHDLMAALAGDNYWTLADSDNDAPD